MMSFSIVSHLIPIIISCGQSFNQKLFVHLQIESVHLT